MRPVRLALLACLALLPALTALADGPVPFSGHVSIWQETVFTLDDDLGDIATAPLRAPRKTATALAAVGVLVLADKPLTRAYQNTVEPALSGFALPKLPWDRQFAQFGVGTEDSWMLSAIVGSYAYGAVSGDRRAMRAATLSTKALALSVLTSQGVLKTIIGRKRPCPNLDAAGCPTDIYTNDPFDFGHFHGVDLKANGLGTSMPSYHFTQYAAVARVYSGIYDNSWVPYGVAGVIAASNVQNHHHWVSDMVAGTLIGLGIGDVVLRNANARASGRLTATPLVTSHGTGLSLGLKF